MIHYNEQISLQQEKESVERYILLENEGPIVFIEYQIQMLRHNKCPGVLDFVKKEINNRVSLRYIVSGKISLMEYLLGTILSRTMLIEILYKISSTVLESRHYLLYPNNFLLQEDCIFLDPLTFNVFLIYAPFTLKNDSDERFHLLLQSLSRRLAWIEKATEDIVWPDPFSIVRFTEMVPSIKYAGTGYELKSEQNQKYKPYQLVPTLNHLYEKKEETQDDFRNNSDRPNNRFWSILLIVQVLLASFMFYVSRDTSWSFFDYFLAAIIVLSLDYILLNKVFRNRIHPEN